MIYLPSAMVEGKWIGLFILCLCDVNNIYSAFGEKNLLSIMKVFANEQLNASNNIEFAFERVESIVGKGFIPKVVKTRYCLGKSYLTNLFCFQILSNHGKSSN